MVFLVIRKNKFKRNACRKKTLKWGWGKKGRRDRIYIKINAHTNAVYSYFDL
jgi:hypothetical protein